MTRLPCKETGVVSGSPGEHLSADLCGPMQVTSLGRARYFLLVKDRVTCYREVYFLETKESYMVALRIKEHIVMNKTETEKRVKTLRTDNGTEFVNRDVESLLKKMGGIKHERTIPYTLEQNGSVERDNRTIVVMARTMLHAANLPLNLCAEIVNTAVYLHNRVPNRKENKSPYELQFGKKPALDHLKVIGSEV
jgi:transposase InsO family protein